MTDKHQSPSIAEVIADVTETVTVVTQPEVTKKQKVAKVLETITLIISLILGLLANFGCAQMGMTQHDSGKASLTVAACFEERDDLKALMDNAAFAKALHAQLSTVKADAVPTAEQITAVMAATHLVAEFSACLD